MPTDKKKHVNQLCLKPNNPLTFWKKLGYPPGQFCTALDEYFPKLERAGCEVIYSGKNNSDIVLGRDRDASLASGYGGSGGTQCGMIDIVVGRLACQPVQKCEVITGPNFCDDGARIYLTQRGDIDKYFGLPKGKVSGKTDNSAAIGIKSDHTRIIGRETVKIYAGQGDFQGLGMNGERNSKGGSIDRRGVIELIAGYRDPKYIHPAVLGTNLVECLKGLYRLIAQTFSALHHTHLIQSKMYVALSGHSHQGTGIGAITTFPDPMLTYKSFKSFAKAAASGFDDMLSIMNTARDEMEYCGVGDPKTGDLIPGWKNITSTKVFLT